MSVAEEQRSEASPGKPDKRNVGRIEEVQGVVIEAVFPEKLPEINHAIAIRRRDVLKEEEAIDIAAQEESYLICEVQQHLGDDRVRAVAMDSTDGLARGLEVIDTGAPITVPVGRTSRSDASSTYLATRSTSASPCPTTSSGGRSTVTRRRSRS